MQSLNFTKTGSLKKHKHVRRWFSISSLCILVAIVAIGFLQMDQWQKHHNLQTQKNKCSNELQVLQTISNQSTLTQSDTKQNKGQFFITLNSLLKQIKTTLAGQTQLEAICVLPDHSIEIKVIASNSSILLKMVDTLAQQAVGADLCITSLEQKEPQKVIGILKTSFKEKVS
jgi:hypothetical protein